MLVYQRVLCLYVFLNRETLKFAVLVKSVGVDLLFGPYPKSKIRKSTPRSSQQIERQSNQPQTNRNAINFTPGPEMHIRPTKIEFPSTQPTKKHTNLIKIHEHLSIKIAQVTWIQHILESRNPPDISRYIRRFPARHGGIPNMLGFCERENPI